MSKDYGTELPSGFKVDAAPQAKAAATSAPKDHGAQLPVGFKVDAAPTTRPSSSVKPPAPVPPQPSTGAFMKDQAKQGFSDLAAMVPLASDVSTNAIQHTRPDALGLQGVLSTAAHLTQSGVNKVREAFGLHPLDFGSHENDSHLASTAKSGWDQMLGVEHTPQPLNSTGGKSKANEYLGEFARFMGGAAVPDAKLALGAEHKLATFLVSTAGTGLASTSAVELKEIGGNIAHKFGLSKETGEKVGEFLGGLAGPGMVGLGAQAAMKGKALAKAGMEKAGVPGLSKEAQQAAANAHVSGQITDSINSYPLGQANMERTAELAKEVPGFKPTVAQASDSPSLIAMHKQRASSSNESLNKATAVDEANAKAIQDFKESKFPSEKKSVVEPGQQPEGDPGLNRPYVKDPVLDPARAQLSATKSINSLEQEKTAADLKRLSDQHARTVDNQAVGEKLRQKYWEAREAEKMKQDINLSSLYADARKQGIKADVSDIRDHVKKVTEADKNTFQDMPPLFSKILQEYPEGKAAQITREAVTPNGAKKPIYKTSTTPATPAKNEASFEELHSMYKQANKDQADAVAAGNSTKAFHMGQIKNRLKSKIDEFEGPAHGEFAQKFKDYNASYAQYARTFKNGAGAEIAKRGKYGEVRDAEDIVSKTILKSADKKKGVQDFLAIHGNDAEAHQLLRDGIMDNFSKATMSTGEFNPKAARNWLARHKSAMDELPELRTHLENQKEIGQALVDRRAVLQKQARKIDQTYLAKVAGSQDADALITKALGNSTDGPKLMKALLVGAKSPESRQAVARAIVDNVSGRGWGLEEIMQHESTLKPVMDTLGPEHWKNLKTIAEAEAIASRVKAPTGVEMKKLEDVGTKYTGTSVKSLFASAKATAAGRMSKGYAIVEGAGRYVYKIKSEEADRLLDEALFNPDIAGTLAGMARATSKPSKQQLLDLKRLSFNAGIVSAVEASGREADGESNKAK